MKRGKIERSVIRSRFPSRASSPKSIGLELDKLTLAWPIGFGLKPVAFIIYFFS